MMVVQETERKGMKAVRVNFENGKNFIFVNTTPHDITFKDPETDIEFVVPQSGILINAKPVEKIVAYSSPITFVTTEFQSNPDDEQKLTEIEKLFKTDYNIKIDKIIIIGSIIAAQAYKGRICAMTPHPDYMRVPPVEKRMNPRKFTIFEKEL